LERSHWGLGACAGRKRVEEADPELLGELLELVEQESRGDPERPLRWTSKSVRRLAGELCGRGHRVGFRTIPRLLGEVGYTMQSPRKSKVLIIPTVTRSLGTPTRP